MARRRLLALAGVLALAACGRGLPGAGGSKAPSDRAVVSLPRVAAHAQPSASSPTVATLERGTEIQILAPAGGFTRARTPQGAEVYLPADAFERLSDRQARESRAAAVAKFPPQPGRAVESCPVLLAPDYGAGRWRDLKDGDDVAVLLADHDFYGIQMDGTLAFVPARCLRLLPSEEPENAPRPTRRPPPPPALALERAPSAGEPTPVPAAAAEQGRREPYELLPAGSEPPVLETRVEPLYPEMARRVGAEGEITLKVVVEADGSVGSVGVERGGHPALVEAATSAVKRWRYRPARVEGKPVSVYKTVRIRFTLRG